MKIDPNATGQVVNKKTLSEIFGISERTFTEDQKDPRFPILRDADRGASNEYDTAQVFRFYLDRLNRKHAAGQSSLSQAKTEEAEASAALKRIQYHEKVGTLILRAAALDLLKRWCTSANQEFKEGIDQLIEKLEEQLDIDIPKEIVQSHVATTSKRVGDYALKLAGGGDGGGGGVDASRDAIDG